MHRPVMLREVMGTLRPASGERVVDCTVGSAGHARALLEAVGPTGQLIGLDVDHVAMGAAGAKLGGAANVRLVRANFAELPDVLDRLGVETVDVIFADLGTSGMQIDDAARGINYERPGPLDMRMDDRLERTAADVLDGLSVEALSDALRDLADEPDHRQIAEWILRTHRAERIEDTQRLVRAVLDAKGISGEQRRRKPWRRPGAAHPAGRTFQALRILVNRELEQLEALLTAAPDRLSPGGRIGILSFQPGEDRLVKRALRSGYETGTYQALSTKPISPRARERAANTRSTSARFRWARKA